MKTKKITQKDVEEAWDVWNKAREKVWNEVWYAWDKAWDKAYELERKFKEQEGLKDDNSRRCG